jgi:hypothetical protein
MARATKTPEKEPVKARARAAAPAPTKAAAKSPAKAPAPAAGSGSATKTARPLKPKRAGVAVEREPTSWMSSPGCGRNSRRARRRRPASG